MKHLKSKLRAKLRALANHHAALAKLGDVRLAAMHKGFFATVNEADEAVRKWHRSIDYNERLGYDGEPVTKPRVDSEPTD